ASAHDPFGEHVSAARSPPSDDALTHPGANHGGGVKFPSAKNSVHSEESASTGDTPTDVLMFAHPGLSIAMGQSDREVHRPARRVTASNDEDGFANAVDRFILKTP